MLNDSISIRLILLVFLSTLIFTVTGFAADKEVPKNIIIMIADGCGYNQINATNFYRFGNTGNRGYDNFPVKYAMSTWSAGSKGYDPGAAWQSFSYLLEKPTDSAASATAMSTGIKTKNGMLGMDENKNVLKTISEQAEEIGKASGVVTSVQYWHATPAAFCAHNESRGNKAEITHEMLFSTVLEVIMGAGHPEYDQDGQRVENPDYAIFEDQETWQTITTGQAGNDVNSDGIIDHWTFIDDRNDFRKLGQGATPDRVFGLARVESTLQEGRSGDKDADPFVVPLIETVPTLTEMSKAAINILDNDPDGFFLMIEGGAVDWASHDSHSGRMIEERIDFDNAIDFVVNWVEQNSSWQETMLIITGDHETGYLTGPGSGDDDLLDEGGISAVWTPLVNNGKGQVPDMKWHSEGHTNQLIPFYAIGAGSEYFHDYAVGIDPVRGKYIDNADIGEVILSLWGMEK